MKSYSSGINSRWGQVTLTWQREKNSVWKITRIYLPSLSAPLLEPAPRDPVIMTVEEKIANLLAGHQEEVPLDRLDLATLRPWQKQVLLKCSEIPRGCVSSYRFLAERLGKKKGARAIGWAMAHNPFPLIIPCHRVIKADGSLGGYGGGLELKKILLLLEGVRFSGPERVDKSCFISL